jgi:hypothetical protein
MQSRYFRVEVAAEDLRFESEPGVAYGALFVRVICSRNEAEARRLAIDEVNSLDTTRVLLNQIQSIPTFSIDEIEPITSKVAQNFQPIGPILYKSSPSYSRSRRGSEHVDQRLASICATTLLIGALAAGVLGIWWFLKGHLAPDGCLDSGHAFDYARWICAPLETEHLPHQPQQFLLTSHFWGLLGSAGLIGLCFHARRRILNNQ